MSFLRICLLAALSAIFVCNAGAETLPKPDGKPILIVSGKITNTNADGEAQFDRNALEALGLTTVVTSNPWYSGKVRFEGVLMSKLLKYVGAEGRTVTAVALNDYVSTIPVEDFNKYDVILAMKRDGSYMQIRDKGPLFIVYPYDSTPELQAQTYYMRSAWQIAKLIVE